MRYLARRHVAFFSDIFSAKQASAASDKANEQANDAVATNTAIDKPWRGHGKCIPRGSHRSLRPVASSTVKSAKTVARTLQRMVMSVRDVCDLQHCRDQHNI
mgnify:FL=1